MPVHIGVIRRNRVESELDSRDAKDADRDHNQDTDGTDQQPSPSRRPKIRRWAPRRLGFMRARSAFLGNAWVDLMRRSLIRTLVLDHRTGHGILPRSWA